MKNGHNRHKMISMRVVFLVSRREPFVKKLSKKKKKKLVTYRNGFFMWLMRSKNKLLIDQGYI